LITRGAELEFEKTRNLETLSSGVLLSVHFRTGSFALEPHFSKRLSELGQVLAVMKSLHVRLDGYADIRGSRRFNRKLSQRRAQAVHEALSKYGINEERIQWIAHGETGSLYPSRDRDGHAFDRRVDIRLSLPGAAS
jgi:outer membrane protein OmpA-like peptidoglycan-associated protein